MKLILLLKIVLLRMNVTGFGPLNWIAGKSVTNVIQENVLQVNNYFLILHFPSNGTKPTGKILTKSL